MNLVQQLQSAAALRDAGALTPQEYARVKQKLLAPQGGGAPVRAEGDARGAPDGPLLKQKFPASHRKLCWFLRVADEELYIILFVAVCCFTLFIVTLSQFFQHSYRAERHQSRRCCIAARRGAGHGPRRPGTRPTSARRPTRSSRPTSTRPSPSARASRP